MKALSSTLRRLSIVLSFIFSITSLLIIIFLVISMSSCSDEVKITRKYTYLEPVYATTDEVRLAFDVIEPQVIQSTGKIYYLNGYLFINEPGEGIHVIDNKDPKNPQNIAFINIPGNFDMAAKGNVLYADSYIDLLAIDISNVNDVKILKRVEDVFPVRYDIYYQNGMQEDPVILTEYREVEVVEIVEDELGGEIYPGYYSYRGGFAVDFLMVQNDMAQPTSFNNANPVTPMAGIGGSMARFTIMENHLYTIDDYNMQVFDISSIQDPIAGNKIDIGWNIETIFPYQGNLFIGSQNGMYIYDATDPENPVQQSTFEHVRSCDPVIVDGEVAYVTLRSGTECEGFTNQLDVVDVKDLNNPVLLRTFQMENPHGLGKDGDLLFITEGEYGLKVFNAEDPKKIGDRLLKHYDDLHAFDVIPFGGVLMLIGQDGLYQYDYTDPENIQLLSTLSVIRE